MAETIPFTDSRWSLRHKAQKDPKIDDSTIVLTTNDGTDWWRTLERDSRDGVVYGFEVDTKDGIEISVELDIAHRDRLAGTTWVKVGIEFDGQLLAGGVVTYPYSDWSVHPHPGGPKRYSLTLVGRTLKFYEEGLMIREVNVFGDGESKAIVGVMACSPLGGGVEGTFKDFKLKLGVE